MIEGTTIINHKIRYDLNLSLQEYVVMDFFAQCVEKGINPEYNSINMIAVEFEAIKEFSKGLENRGLLVGYVPTKKWTQAIKKSKVPAKRKVKEFTPPTLEEVIEFFKSEGYNKALAEKVYKHYSLGDWTDKNGKKLKFWKRNFISWFSDEYKLSTGTGILIEPRTYNR